MSDITIAASHAVDFMQVGDYVSIGNPKVYYVIEATPTPTCIKLRKLSLAEYVLMKARGALNRFKLFLQEMEES